MTEARQDMSRPEAELLGEMFRRAVDAVQPARCLGAHLPDIPAGDLVIIGAGKAATAMARVAVKRIRRYRPGCRRHALRPWPEGEPNRQHRRHRGRTPDPRSGRRHRREPDTGVGPELRSSGLDPLLPLRRGVRPAEPAGSRTVPRRQAEGDTGSHRPRRDDRRDQLRPQASLGREGAGAWPLRPIQLPSLRSLSPTSLETIPPSSHPARPSPTRQLSPTPLRSWRNSVSTPCLTLRATSGKRLTKHRSPVIRAWSRRVSASSPTPTVRSQRPRTWRRRRNRIDRAG